MKRLLLFFTLISLACGSSVHRRQLDLFPSATVLPTQTARVIVQSTTPEPTLTPAKKQVQTATQTAIPACFTVNALEAVNLRPSPSDDNYPITQLPNGTRLTDKGGRKDGWAFVEFGELAGWVNMAYLDKC